MDVCHEFLPESLLSSSRVLVSSLPLKKEVIFCAFVCVSSWVSVSFNKVVTDLANQQTVFYPRQPEHRGDLCLTDGIVVCAGMHVHTLHVSWDECRSSVCVCEHIFICLYLHMHMGLHCIFLS